MVSQWTTVTFGEVVRLEQGLCFNKKTNHLMAETGIPLLRIADLVNNTQTKFVDEERVPKKFIANPQDIIYSRTGQVGLVFKGKVGVVHNNCFRVIPQEGIERDYVYWYLRQPSIIQKARSLAGGAAQPDLGHDAFKSISFSYPELEIQRRIIGILSTYDDLIENNTRRIKILEEMAQVLYREWFVKFRFPGHETVKMVESELGMVPEGWGVKLLGDTYLTSSGGTPSRKRSDYYGGLINWVKTKELNDNFIFETEEKITDIGLQKSSAKIFPEYTVIMAMYGATIGKLGILAIPAATNQACCAILKNKEPFCHQYIFLFLFENRQKIFSLGMGAAQQNISQAVIKKIKILEPPAEIIQMFNRLVNPVSECLKSLQRRNENLRRTRDLLLPKLISGEVNVENIDVQMPNNGVA